MTGLGIESAETRPASQGWQGTGTPPPLVACLLNRLERDLDWLFCRQLPGTPRRVEFGLTHSKQTTEVPSTRNSFRGSVMRGAKAGLKPKPLHLNHGLCDSCYGNRKPIKQMRVNWAGLE